MKKVFLLLFISLFIGMGLGIMGSQINYYREKDLREKRILNLEEITKGQQKQLLQLQTKLEEHQIKIEGLKTKLSEKQEELIQLRTDVNDNHVKQIFQDEDLEEVLEAFGNKRVFFP